MKEGFVADASVGVAWAVAAQAGEETSQLLERLASGAVLVVPGLWGLEVANSLLALHRRKRIVAADYRFALSALERLPLEVDDEGVRGAFGRISELAVEHGLSVYDAAYLELASRRQLPLASRDNALRAAAKAARVKLLL